MPGSLSRCFGLLFLSLAHTAIGLDLFNEEGLAEVAPAAEAPQHINYAVKRAGFVGMRGKKDVEDFNNFENYAPEVADKRGKAMGFTGMRGKKDLFGLNALSEDQWKLLLAANNDAARYPMPMDAELRRSEEVGSKRGNSAFVGMRGKKSFSTDVEELQRAEALAEVEAELRQLYSSRALGKRAGFVGMRGKKRQGNKFNQKFRRAGGGSSGFVGMRG